MNEADNDHIADAIKTLATHVKYLGVGDAATTMGAIEYLAAKVKGGNVEIAEALNGLAGAVREVVGALGEIADAVKEKND